MKNNKVIVDLFFKRGKYLLYLINERVKSGEKREDIIRNIFAFCPSLEAEKIAINTIGLKPENVIRYINVFNGKKDSDLDGYIKWIKEMIEIDKLGLNNVIGDGCELFCIQNPPYSGTLHLDFLDIGVDLITKFRGKMVIIEPSTWLIDLRKNKNTEMYNNIKDKIKDHVESVVIENHNKAFGTNMDMPFVITAIDMSKTFDTIDYKCCGEHKNIKSLYDCNLIGDYSTIQSIFSKVISYGDMMSNHIYKQKDNNVYEAYLRYWNYQLYALGSNYCGVVNQYNSKSIAVYRDLPIGEFFSSYVDSLFYGEVSENKPLSKRGNLCDCLCGKTTELENWVYNVSNNKLFIFLTICTIFDKHNKAINLIPFLSDKRYSNEEINKIFNFTNDELNLIDFTLNKFNYNSPWFKRYICGKSDATDDEVAEYIKKITEEC